MPTTTYTVGGAFTTTDAALAEQYARRGLRVTAVTAGDTR